MIGTATSAPAEPPRSRWRHVLTGLGRRVAERLPAAVHKAPSVKAAKIFRDYVGGVYYPIHRVSQWRQLSLAPRLIVMEYLVYRVDQIAERNSADDLELTRGPDYDRLHRYKAAAARIIRLLGGWNDTVAKLLDDGEAFVRLENAATSRTVQTEADRRQMMELRPTDVRILHAMTEQMLGQRSDADLHRTLWPAEVLADIANDLDQYHADIGSGQFNIYASYLRRYGAVDGPRQLTDLIDSYRRDLTRALDNLSPDQRGVVARCCARLIGDRLDVLPDPTTPAPEKRPGPPPVSVSVVTAGTVCVLAWIVAYASIIHRGFADHTFGMPIAALAANLSWEFLYGFILDPFADYIHLWSIPCFLIDLVILWQAWRFGAADFNDPFLQDHFPTVLAAAVTAALPITYRGFKEFNDPDGEYTGFGINLMMSALFLAMLTRRGNAHGQSMYAALAKWLGTFMAWVATALTVTTSPERPLPSSLASFVKTSAAHTNYPLTPMINLMYWCTFVLDGIYSYRLHRRLVSDGINPWTRF